MPETRNLRRWLIVGVLILLTGCSGQAGTPSTTTFNSTTTVADSTTITAGSTSTTLATTTTTTIPVELVDCDGRDGGLLCEGYVLIHRYYVDPVDDSTLAAAATEGVEALETSGADSVSCAIPNPSFRVVCDAMAVEGASTERASEAALIGMVAALDPNSGYLDSEALRLIQEDQTGQVEGIGALVASEDLTAADPQSTPCGVISATCRLIVVSTFSNGPADRAGLEAGDVLVAVNAESIDGWNIDQVTATVRGRAGTDVTLTVVRDGRELDITITREAVFIPVVETEVVGGVGYLKLNLFTDTSDRQLHDALSGLLDLGVQRLVLDLRDNPGGALDATVNIASEFLDSGVVVRTEAPSEETSYPVEIGGIATDIEVVVLVNRGSASASEVLSAALQERERALIIGENTFGKNTVQQRFNLDNGGALKLTVARWVTEAGADFGVGGVTPDIPADIDPELPVDEVVAQVASLAGWATAA